MTTRHLSARVLLLCLLLLSCLLVVAVVDDGCDPGGPTWPDVTGSLDR